MEKSRNIPGKSVLILITNSFAALNVIHSGLLKRIEDDHHIYLISTMIRKPELLHINSHYNMTVELIDFKIPHEGRFLSLLRRFEKMLFHGIFKIETQQIKSMQEKSVLLKIASLILPFLLPRHLKIAVLNTLRQYIIYLTSKSSNLIQLLDYQFDGVISSSPLDIRENSIVNFLSRRKARSIAMVISWDNLTSKGLINADHDAVLVWNQFMADEFERFYSVFNNQEKVCITGIPRFDIYFRKGLSRCIIRSNYQISLHQRIIFFATSSKKHFPAQKTIATHLVHYAAVRKDVMLFIRCHPDDCAEDYESVKNQANIQVWKPQMEKTEAGNPFSEWLPDPDFLDSLFDMLSICDVCVQVASTIRLDAAACDKPVISIAYDGDTALPYLKSVRKLYDYSHQIPLNRLKIDTMVYSKEDLYAALDKILSKPPLEQHSSKMIHSFTHFTEPVAVDKVADCIAEWLD